MKNIWVFLLFLLSGIVLGGFIGEYLGNIQQLGWLRYGNSFGFENPLVLNLEIIKLQFGLTLKITVSGILGMIISIFVYKKLVR